MAADGGLQAIPDPSAMTGSRWTRMAEELVQRALAELGPRALNEHKLNKSTHTILLMKDLVDLP